MKKQKILLFQNLCEAKERAMPDSGPEESAARPRSTQTEAETILYCPVCSTRLTERKCKLICEKCGYYLSCSDYY